MTNFLLLTLQKKHGRAPRAGVGVFNLDMFVPWWYRARHERLIPGAVVRPYVKPTACGPTYLYGDEAKAARHG